MTRDEVLALEAGKELDALVATEVMGWAKCVHPDTNWLLDEEWKKLGEGEVFWYNTLGLISAANKNGYRVWRPSYNIASSFEVVEKMEKYGYGMVIWTMTKIVEVYLRGVNDNYLESIQAATLPLAICRAALLAKMQP